MFRSACQKNISSQALSQVVKPYETIPGPRGRGLPLLGHMHLYLKKPHGFKKAWKNLLKLRHLNLKPEQNLMKLNLPLFNQDNDGRVVVTFDDRDIELVYRNEGKYPYRY